MRILLTTESSGWSGGAAQTVLLAKQLLSSGHRVWIGCQSTSDVYKAAQQSQVPVFPLRIRGDVDLIAVSRLIVFILKERIEVLHAQHPKAHAVGLLAALLIPRPLLFLITRRVSFRAKNHVFSRWKYRAKRIDALIAVSQGIKDVLVEDGVPSEKVHVIYSAVDPASFKPGSTLQLTALRDRLGLRADLPILIKVANYSEWKGQSVFLDAAAHLLSQGCSAQFVLAGRGTDGPEMADHIRRLKIEPYVFRLGFRTDVSNLLALASGSVNAAIAGEGLSGALRESLFLGIPVIASDVSGNQELVQDGITGRLVPPGNPIALAEAMRWLIKNQSAARQWAEQGREKVKALMLIERTAQQTEALYKRLPVRNYFFEILRFRKRPSG